MLPSRATSTSQTLELYGRALALMIKLLSRQAQTKFKLLSMMLFISRFKQKKRKKKFKARYD